MKIWHQYPFVRLVFPFIAGIATAIYFHLPVSASLLPYIFILLLVYGLLVYVVAKRISYSLRWVNGLLIHLILFLLGYENTRLHTPSIDPENISHHSARQSSLIIRLDEPVTERPNSYKIIAKVLAVKDSTSWKTASGKIILYFEKDVTVKHLAYGDEVILQTTINQVSPPMNPGEFNYRRYLANRGIYNQGYVKSADWKMMARDKGNPVFAFALKVRDHFLQILEKRNISGDEFAVASALLVGCTDHLDADQMKHYAGSGAIHILSVSGLHVGIIYIFLNVLLTFLNRKRRTLIIKVLLMIIFIWLYALITGFSPSVLRASLMFTIIIVGELLTRKVNTYNTIAASTVLLLIFQPYLITDVGFQLSYLAVAGIVWLYRPISNFFIPQNRILRLTWQSIAVSIAATLVTFPLTVFYFRQFPNLFLVTNLIAVPLSSLIIYTGIAVLVFSPLGGISSFLGMVLSELVRWLNFTVKVIEEQPFAVAEGLNIKLFEMVILFIAVILVATFMLNKTRGYLVPAMSLLVVLLISFTIRSAGHLRQKIIVTYNINKTTAIDFLCGKEGLLVADSGLIKDQGKFGYHIQNNRVQQGISSGKELIAIDRSFKTDHVLKQGNFIRFFDKTMLLVNPDLNFQPQGSKLKINYLMLTHDPAITIDQLAKAFDFEMVIIDGSNSLWKTVNWIKECRELAIRFHSTRSEGAWEVNI